MQARQLPARHGVAWLLAGLQLFRRSPPLLTALTFAYLFAVLFLNLLPLIGPFLLALALPALNAIVANGVRALEQNRPVGKVVLLQGLAAHRVALVRLGGLHLAGSLAILALSLLIEGGPQSLGKLENVDAMAMLAIFGRLLLIAVPVLMAFWFAPLLVAWDGVPAAKSVFFSFVAAVRNWRAFAVFVLAVAAVGIALPGLVLIAAGAVSATLLNVLLVALRMVLVFVLAPVLIASVYLSYLDVFHGHAGDEEPVSDVPPATDA